MASQSNSPAGPRPKRFAVELPLQVRDRNDGTWWAATSEDISANGIRFRAQKCPPPQTPLDVKLQLPASLTGDGTVRLQCSGYVVRSSESASSPKDAHVAVAFRDIHLVNGESPSDTRPADRTRKTEISDLFHRLNTVLFLIMGRSELLSTGQYDANRSHDLAAQNLHSVEEASQIVRAIAATLK
jgi:hypothetical protein